jgi:hypothetical protein
MKRIFGSVAVIIMASTSFSQTQFTSIEEILKRDTTISLQENQKQFNMDGPVYSEITNGKYLGIITANINEVQNGNRMIKESWPKSIYWFGADTLITNIPNKSLYETAIAFLKNPDRMISLSSSKDEVSINFYTTDGKLIDTLVGFDWITPSPSGKYFFLTPSAESEYPLDIYNEKGEKYMHISTKFEMAFQAAWFSDSLLIVGSGNNLLLWDFTQTDKLWEIEMPQGCPVINDEFTIISSQPAGIILVYNPYTACYCYSSEGDFLWQRSGAGGFSWINGFGICDVTGRTAIVTVNPGRINLDLLAKDGRVIAQANKDCIPGTGYYAARDRKIDVSPNYIIYRFTSCRGNPCKPQENTLFTSMVLSNQNNELNIDYVDGLWFLLNDDTNRQAFIGVDNANPNLVKSIVIK